MLIIRRYNSLVALIPLLAFSVVACSPGVESAKASVESIEILILESFPVQIHVVARGHLPDDCTEIGEITRERQGNTFSVTITTARPANVACAEMLVSFEEVISLDVLGLPAGTYTVDVNGVRDSFQLAVDNVPPEEPGS
jgi:inhibitor of cysteine peptidase